MSWRAAIAVKFAILLLTPAGLRAQDGKNPEPQALQNGVRPGSAGGYALSCACQLTQARDKARAFAHIIADIEFVGLRRISPEALKAQISSRLEDQFDPERIEHDVRTLARIGWFESVRVEAEETESRSWGAGAHRINLTFYLPELPFLTAVEYHGSRLLSRQQIEKLLAEKNLTPKLGQPENRVTLYLVAKEIEAALQELGHPEAHVGVTEQVLPQATARVQFDITDGPRLPLGRITFEGDTGLSQKILRRKMRRMRPGTLFAGLRDKDVYTQAAFEEDREHLLSYYRDHGYPDARIGQAQVAKYDAKARRWLLWPHKAPQVRLTVHIPIEAGALYKVAALGASGDLKAAAFAPSNRQPTDQNSSSGQVYSEQVIENVRRVWQAQLDKQARRFDASIFQHVEVVLMPDANARSMRIELQLSKTPSYVVRHLEFQGTRRFPDRYLRSRFLLKEGQPLDDRVLEASLARVARSGYFKPIKKEDVHIATSETARSADVIIHVEELGQQRASLVGGRGQFGSTLGVAYTLFNLFHGEELLTSKIEGGPESLQLALGLAKEGFLGSRGTLALSVFNMFLRPHLNGTVKGPFFRQQSSGLNADWTYAMTRTDSLGVDYEVTHSRTQYSLALPADIVGVTIGNLRSETSSHSVGARWARDTGSERIQFAQSVSGGWLGGSENVLRSRAEYSRIVRDPVFSSQNAWAFRVSLNGAGSYSGDMPYSSRFFAGDEFVRGLHQGELGPIAIVASTSMSGTTRYSAVPAGANLISAANSEYRVRLGSSAEAAGFFDVGAGRLLPNWLGRTKPSLADVTNGVVHGSTGIELRWRLPGVGVPVRSYYALNLLGFRSSLLMPDASFFRAQNRRSGFGWGLGTLF